MLIISYLISITCVILLTSLAYFLFGYKLTFIKNRLLVISLSWFFGQYIFTFVVYILAILLTIFTRNVLTKASYIILLIGVIIALRVYQKRYWALLLKVVNFRINYINITDVLVLIFIFIISCFIFLPHLNEKNGRIYQSPVYWDFKLHMPLIQNFVYGDNFPPENVSFSGFPLTYHFFWQVYTAMYASYGLGLVHGINFVSIMTFSFLLILLYSLAKEFFNSRLIGLLVIVFTLTTGSMRFIYDLKKIKTDSLINIVKLIITNKENLFFFSFLNKNPFGYNGTMFNLFYFIEERHLVMAVIYLFVIIILIYYRKYFSDRMCLILGLLSGLFFLWHLQVALLIYPFLLILLLLEKHRKKTLLFLMGSSIVLFPYYIYLRELTKSPWFLKDIAKYPALNFEFPTMGKEYPLSFMNAVKYYLFAYGVKVFYIFAGFFFLWRYRKSLFLLFLSITMPIFILVNTIQLSPLSVYDNHKWLRPLNVILDLIIAFAFVKTVRLLKIKVLQIWYIPVTLILLTFGGFIELMPVLNSKPVSYAGNPNSNFSLTIRSNTNPKSSFITNNQYDIQLSGRKVFSGEYIGGDLRLNIDQRLIITKNIYSANSIDQFCEFSLKYNINYLEYDQNKKLPVFYQSPFAFPSLSVKNESGKNIIFLDINKGCKNVKNKN